VAMAVRNLQRQARPFRILGWSLFACALVSLPHDAVTTTQLAGALILSLAGALSLDLLLWAFDGAQLKKDAIVRSLQAGELLLVPALLIVLELPIALVIAVFGALVNANVAIGGSRALLVALGLIAISLGVAWLLGVTPAMPLPGEQVWVSGVTLLLVFTVALADVGFRLTQKLDDHRRQWHERLNLLQPFVPQGLVQYPPAQQRQWITVVVVDLVEFTRKSMPMPPEAVGQVLDDLLDAVVARANQCGGTLDKFMGDGALLFFCGEPGRAQAASAAVGFAQRLIAELPRLNQRWQGYGAPECLQLRLGIASGYCSIGQWGTREVRAYTMIGACVGLAERLQAVARPDSLAVCPVTARLLSSADYPAELPVHIEVAVGSVPLALSGTECTPKGFARMRVYRPSAKVHAPSV